MNSTNTLSSPSSISTLSCVSAPATTYDSETPPEEIKDKPSNDLV
jgi:hypothetical protein